MFDPVWGCMRNIHKQANYFMSQRGVKIKPKSEISCHNTLTSVISGLFHTRYIPPLL